MARRLFAVALVLGIALSGLARPVVARTIEPLATVATSPTRVSADQPRVLVRFRPGAAAADRERAIASVGGTVDRVLDAIGVTRLALAIPATEDETGLTALRLARDPAVLSVEPDSTGSVQFTPNDDLYLTDPSFGLGQWGIRKAHVDQAWDVARGSSAVIVAIIDTGIDANHPDLAGIALPGATFVTAPDPQCTPGSTIDDNGHGTHVAGLIAANGNNGQGIAGIAFGVRILPIKALDCDGSGLLSDVAASVTWATDHGARIINISLGSNAAQQTLADAIHYAVTHNVLVIAAAGNCGVAATRCDGIVNEPQYPGAFPEVLAVAATDPNDVRATFSNENSYVALSAPGVRIWSTTPTYPTTLSNSTPGTSTYAALSGTSQAAPFVAGVAALLLSKDPSLTAAQLADRLRAGADDLGVVGPDPDYGAGRVNALKSISGLAGIATYGATYDVSGLPSRGFTIAPIIAPVKLTNTSNFLWSPNGPNPVRLGFHWTDLSGTTIVWDGQRTLLPADVPVGGQVTVNATIPTPATPGTYLLKLDLVREGLAWFSGSNVASVPVTIVVTSGGAASYVPGTSAPSVFVLGANAFSVTVANTGAVTWLAGGANPVHLSYHWLAADRSMVVWDGARAVLPADIAPGQSAVVALPVTSPPIAGSYVLRLDLVQEGVAWFSGQGAAPRDIAITVTTGYSASYAVTALTPLQPGGRIALPVTVKNDGLATWSAAGPNPLHIAAHVLDATGQVVSWDGERTSLPADVAPGQGVTLVAFVTAPATPGVYTVKVDLVREGIAWLSSYGVAPATVALQDIEDYRAAFQIAATQVSRAAPTISVTVTNSSLATWSTTGAAPVHLSSHWLAADGAVLLWDGPRAQLGAALAPGASATVSVPLAAPPAGATSLVVDLVAEGLRWFGSGSPRAVTLVP